jgi:hypothetical protein
MRIVMAPPPATAHSVTCPAFDAGPGHGNEEHDDRERNRDRRNIQHVAERVVRRRLFERLWLLNDGDEHHTSGAAPLFEAVRADPWSQLRHGR